ncbi:hypothetical protein K493DRAFT_382235 [Basidiobolus meristosporus CBS 931.73]|uniref:RNI-like protein n=1 Tax=Basidiobolus meristosporus CBS 931.73 TaxID=1314790 RepID=A0A1Y1XWJ9_9FUNG|nr:hypothetical protein K493DRAFT_382235 [Basidiobolus meristosporus CBS 931.73]|eukprot:ORX89724.1 hypothetical protein K493DRAFT_382235 [Basidiobolus meristosporus CBS 931.73]
MLLRTHLSCTDPDGFGSDEKLRFSKIDSICVPPVDYLTKIVMFLQRLITQIGTSPDEGEMVRYSPAISSPTFYTHYKPLYPYLSLARTVNLVKFQESLRVVNGTSKPVWCIGYTTEEALIDQKITQKLWSLFKGGNYDTIHKLVWRGMVPLKDIFLDTELTALQELELHWRYDPTSSPCTEDIYLDTICKSARSFRKISLHLDPWVAKIEDSDIAALIAAQEPGYLRALHVEGAHKPLTETIDALLTHHGNSLQELRIVDYIPSKSGLEKIGQFNNLKCIEFHDCFNMSDKEFRKIYPACKNLQELHLCKLPYVSCGTVRKIIETAGPSLHKLVVSQVGTDLIDSETLQSMIRYSSNLRYLDIQKMTFPAAEMCEFMRTAIQLVHIALGEPIANTPLCGDFIVHTAIRCCRRLKYLHISDLVITENSLKDLNENSRLNYIAFPLLVS